VAATLSGLGAMDWLVRDYLLTWMHEAGDHARAWGCGTRPRSATTTAAEAAWSQIRSVHDNPAHERDMQAAQMITERVVPPDDHADYVMLWDTIWRGLRQQADATDEAAGAASARAAAAALVRSGTLAALTDIARRDIRNVSGAAVIRAAADIAGRADPAVEALRIPDAVLQPTVDTLRSAGHWQRRGDSRWPRTSGRRGGGRGNPDPVHQRGVDHRPGSTSPSPLATSNAKTSCQKCVMPETKTLAKLGQPPAIRAADPACAEPGSPGRGEPDLE